MEAERALRSIRGGDVRKEEEEERKRAKGAADPAVGAPNWHFCPSSVFGNSTNPDPEWKRGRY